MPAELGRNFSFGEEADFFLKKIWGFILLLVLLHLMHHGVSDHAISIGRHIFATIHFKTFPTGYAFTWHSIARTGANSYFGLPARRGDGDRFIVVYDV